MSIEILGYCAVVLGALSTIPQLYQIFKTKQVRDINFLFFLMRSISSLMYIIYGSIKKDYIMMSSAIMPLILEMCVLFLYFKYHKTVEENEE
jgi:MtN3 and saliva related transmembrane protein